MELKVEIELGGTFYPAGSIIGGSVHDACFRYAEEYLSGVNSIPISSSLPLQGNAFTAEQTRNFFDGLLSEGFTRKTVAQWIHADERDYLKILAALGKECLGALKVTAAADDEIIPCSYEKLSMDQVKALANEGASKSAELITKSRLSLTGASGKVGLYYNPAENAWYLPKGTAPSTHIVKQSHVRLRRIIQNEQLSTLTAKRLGLDVPNTWIISTGGKRDENILFASERYDRVFPQNPKSACGFPMPLRLHQEDLGQVLGITAEDKYETPGQHYMRDLFAILRRYSSDPIADVLKLWDITVFNFLLGNTDAHLKNFSLLHGQNPRQVRLAPAYDLLSTVVYDTCTRELAFRIGDKCLIDEIDRNAFHTAAREIGLGERLAMQRFDRIVDEFENAVRSAAVQMEEEGFEDSAALSENILLKGGFHNL